MTLFIITVCAIIIWRRLGPLFHRHDEDDDGLGPVIGKAVHYSPCPNCATADCQVARGRGEVITRGMTYVLRQYHICQNCGVKSLWHRRLDQWVWTIKRNGVAT